MNQLREVNMTMPGDVDVDIYRFPAGTQSLFGDTLRIDLATFSTLDTFVNANGGVLNLNFEGGDDGLLAFGDDVQVEGTGTFSVGYGLNIVSS